MPTEVVGVVALRKALTAYAPDLAKELTKELGKVLKPVVNEARSFVPPTSPMSGWQPRAFSEAAFPMYDNFGYVSYMLYTSYKYARSLFLFFLFHLLPISVYRIEPKYLTETKVRHHFPSHIYTIHRNT